MKTDMICFTILGLLATGLLSTGLVLASRAARMKTAQQNADHNRAIADLQHRADQAGADACNSEADLEKELSDGTY